MDRYHMPVHQRPGVSRRGLLRTGLAGLVLASPLGWQRGAVAQAGRFGVHGLSIFGELKYPVGFRHFSYINPAAPKGGGLNFQPGNWYFNQNTQTFDTLNGYATRGSAPPRVEFTFDSLMASAHDEPDSIYGLVAETVDVSADGNVFTFHLRAEPRFHDGTPLTAADVAFSLTTLKTDGHPTLRTYLRHLVSAEAVDARTAVMTFDGNQSRFAPLIAAGMPIFSAAYYDGREFGAGTLEPPLGSGPYRIGRFEQGRNLSYERVEDYWAADLPVNVGHYNFDEIRIEFFRDRQVAFEAFKKGVIEIREEFTSSVWATGYDFPAVQAGDVQLIEFPTEKRPSLQAWYLNGRREKLADRRTRKALDYCFDFEWTNANIFYGVYRRSSSIFEKSTLKAQGSPEGAELELLETIRDLVPEEVFGPAYVPPMSDGSGADRSLLREAARLLREAGWRRDGSRVVDEGGKPFELEFLIRAPVFERVLGPLISNLEAVGIAATTRLVDASQFQARLQEFDFDVVGSAVSFSPTPLEGLDTSFASDAADTPGSRNFAGIADPAVDRLLEAVSNSQSREELEIAARALDRVVRANHYLITNWYSDSHRMAIWDKFAWPDEKPDYFFPYETTWWAKA